LGVLSFWFCGFVLRVFSDYCVGLGVACLCGFLYGLFCLMVYILLSTSK